MNTYTISLSSNTSSGTQTLETVDIMDYTELTLDLSDIYIKNIPIFLTIDWGDSIETFDNDIYGRKREEVNIFNPYPILTTKYKHKYYPSSDSLYKMITIQVLIYYSNDDYYTITIPIKIRTYDFFESLYDIKIEDVSILPKDDNPKKYYLKATLNNQYIELENSTK